MRGQRLYDSLKALSDVSSPLNPFLLHLAMVDMLVLFETPLDFALFKALDKGKLDKVEIKKQLEADIITVVDTSRDSRHVWMTRECRWPASSVPDVGAEISIGCHTLSRGFK
ncbi:hypothetical protein Zm00014a_044003 [Zea mays]|uniref:Uncharacterized protein n=1 Tax=Zea mays TaxID=4577 RepID=A0A3L6E551_MAIZE|nr:hypothetical protein Zm00014a_044003 [Zea mays]